MAATADWLLSALDELGISYARRVTLDGLPYAGFTMVDGAGRTRALTAIAPESTVRITVHDVGRFDPRALMAATTVMSLGRAFRVSGSENAEVVVSCYVGAGLAAAQVATLLDHLMASLDPWPQTPLPLPPVGSMIEVGIDDLAGPVRRRGDPLVDGRTVRVAFTMDECLCHLSVESRAAGWVSVYGEWAGMPRISDDESWRVLQRLQNWTVAGRYLVLDVGTLAVDISSPVVNGEVAHGVDWTLSQATLMLQVARRHLSV